MHDTNRSATPTRGIETVYGGIRFRSRLEAKWAAFFNRIGWKWTYEPFDGNGYIPDFLIDGKRPFLVEVKPAVTQEQYEAPIAKITTGLAGVWSRDILIVGADPLPSSLKRDGAYEIDCFVAGRGAIHRAGLLCEQINIWGAAVWFSCRECRSIAVLHGWQTWSGRPCGHWRSADHVAPLDLKVIRDAWAEATNAVRWTA